jgi:DNA-binding response OmpR family regulator
MRVVVGDDQPDILRGLRLLFRTEGIDGVFASSPAKVLGAVQNEDLDIALLDLEKTPDENGTPTGAPAGYGSGSSTPVMGICVAR